MKKRFGEKKKREQHEINEKIKAEKIRVVSEDKGNLGIMSREDALKLAEESGLDLVKVGEQPDGTAVAKLIDYGKYLYIKKKQESESKKKQKAASQTKEIKMRPNIGDADYETKMRRAIEFLKEGMRVKFTLQFRGREMLMKKQLGKEMFERVEKTLREAFGDNFNVEHEANSGMFWSKTVSVKRRK